MIPSTLAAEVSGALRDFLSTGFGPSNPALSDAVKGFLDDPDNLLKGPYLSVDLPFQRAPEGGEPFPETPLGFTPYRHQRTAFDRLTGGRSTVIATGTGSGKTECFLYPVLDHCRTQAGMPGVKAIVVYPNERACVGSGAAHRCDRRTHSVASGQGDRGVVRGRDRCVAPSAHGSGPPHREPRSPARTSAGHPAHQLQDARSAAHAAGRFPRSGGTTPAASCAFWWWTSCIRSTARKGRTSPASSGGCGHGFRRTMDWSALARRPPSAARKTGRQSWTTCRMSSISHSRRAPWSARCVRGSTSFFAMPSSAHTSCRSRTLAERMDPGRYPSADEYVRAQYELFFGEPPAGGLESPEWRLALGEKLREHAAFVNLLRVLEGSRPTPVASVLERLRRSLPVGRYSGRRSCA